MGTLATVATSSLSSVAFIALVLWLARNVLLQRIKSSIQAEYDEKLERLRADLRRENDELLTRLRVELEKKSSQELAHLEKELDVLLEKELGGHRDKIQIYRLVVDVLAELYADIFKAQNENDLRSLTYQYNRGWIRCYGYLSMLAPQPVMDAFDAINDYVLRLISGRAAPQPWSETRKLALLFVNEIRKDIGIDSSKLNYHGSL